MWDMHRWMPGQISISPQYEEAGQGDILHRQSISIIQKARIMGLHYLQHLQPSLSCWSEER